jgi:hypothetical protein
MHGICSATGFEMTASGEAAAAVEVANAVAENHPLKID